MTAVRLRRLAPALSPGAAGSSTLTPRRHRRAVRSHRSFDPRVVGELECAAWVAYYRRDWLAFLGSALRVGRHVFGLSWKTTIQCSWLVLRANQLWAPDPGSDVERSRRMMERFYRIVQQLYDEPFDPARAADLEVEWWRVHRAHQRSTEEGDCPALADALARLYSHVYGVPERLVRSAADQRASAMRYSDQWVREGCHQNSPLVAHERDALVRSYSALLTAVRPGRDERQRGGR
jgi:hypothetical protein